jgi:hypothetical protein
MMSGEERELRAYEALDALMVKATQLRDGEELLVDAVQRIRDMVVTDYVGCKRSLGLLDRWLREQDAGVREEPRVGEPGWQESKPI